MSLKIFPNLSSLRHLYSDYEEAQWQEKRRMEKLGTHAVVTQAKQAMESVKIPMYRVDVFNQKHLAYAKTLFSPSCDKDFFSVDFEFRSTLEGYIVDKHLSGSINSAIVDDTLHEFENFIRQAQTLKEKETAYYNAWGQIANRPQYQFADVTFMLRILDRLYIQEQAKLCLEQPPPLSLESLTRFKNAIPKMVAEGKHLTDLPELTGGKLNGAQRNTYLRELFDTQNQRMLDLLKSAYNKDKQVKETDPQAPLTHLATLEGYEKEIQHKRLQLVLKIAAVAIGIFFFSKIALRLR